VAASNLKLFDENKANMLSDEEYNTNTQRLNGVQTGVASSSLQNKTLYQTSLVAYAIGQLMIANGKDATDSAAVSTFVANMDATMLQKVKDIATTEEAQQGLLNTKYMTPALTKVAIEYMCVLKSGSTMTGPLILSGAPTQENQAATKSYVDSSIGGIFEIGDTIKSYSNKTGNWHICDNSKYDSSTYSTLYSKLGKLISTDNIISYVYSNKVQNLKSKFKNYNDYICWLEVSGNSVSLCYTTDFSTINRRSIYNNRGVIIGDWIIVPEKNTILISISIEGDLYFLYTTGGLDGSFSAKGKYNDFDRYHSLTYENGYFIFVTGDNRRDYRFSISYATDPSQLGEPQEWTGVQNPQLDKISIYYNDIRKKYYYAISEKRFSPYSTDIYECDTINGNYTLSRSYINKNNGFFYFNNYLYVMYADFIYKIDKVNYDLISCFCSENINGLRVLTVCQDCVLFVTVINTQSGDLSDAYILYQFRNDKIVNKLNMLLDLNLNLLYAYSNYFVYSLNNPEKSDNLYIYVNNYGSYYPWFNDKITYIKQS